MRTVKKEGNQFVLLRFLLSFVQWILPFKFAVLVHKVVNPSKGRGLYGIVNAAGIITPPGIPVNLVKAGIGKLREVEPLKFLLQTESDVEKDLRAVLEVNLVGIMRVNSAFLDLILESKGFAKVLSS